MSTITTENLTLDDLNHFWSAEGLPVFYADREDICDVVEQMGFSIYYLLANQKQEVKPPVNKSNNNNNKHNNNNNKHNPPSAPTYINKTEWFKVVNNFVGRSVSKCSPSLADNFLPIEEMAHYTMPLIPHVIVDKLDQFFRLVDAQHGTESIVMLTYDTTKEGPEGWGILVPDQENTAAHCNYDPHSIAEMKPDNVMIVGSVHSHPKMAAYASGTDHADQADFDGIHITYGWQKSVNNGATQYHIELQMAGNAYTLQPEDVFEDFVIQKEPDPDVVEWSSKVKKELPLPSRAGEFTSPSLLPPKALQQAPISLGTGLPKNQKYDELDWVKSLKNIFDTCQVPYGTIIVGEIDVETSQDYICPSCDSVLDHYCIYDGFCDVCFIPLSAKGTSIAEVMKLAHLYAKYVGISTDEQVYLVGFEDQKDKKNLFVMPVCESSLEYEIGDSSNSKSYYDEDYDEYTPFDYLVCCGVHIDDIESCFCSPRIMYDDYLDYEKIAEAEKIYKDKYVNCIGCEHYYSPTCNQMRSLLVDFMKDSRNHTERLTFGQIKSIDGLNCEQYQPYVVNTIESALYYD